MCSQYNEDESYEPSESEQCSERADEVLARSCCMKCGSKPKILRGVDPLCRACFLSYCNHKFRATLGKSHQIKPGDQILLAFSGGLSSSALLYMVQQGFLLDDHKRLMISPKLVYINDMSVWNVSLEEQKAMEGEIWKKLESCGFPSYMTCLEMVLLDKDDELARCICWQKGSKEEIKLKKLQSSLQSRLQSSFATFTSQTAKVEFLKYLRTKLLIRVARLAACDKIFVGDSATRLATRLLADIAQGRGAQLASEVGFMDTRHSIPVIRPLREFLAKEIGFYSAFNGISGAEMPVEINKKEAATIHRITEDFVAKLQSDFPATISTICRIGGKLSSNVARSKEDRCAWCQSFLDTIDGENLLAIVSVRLSETPSVNTTRTATDEAENGCCTTDEMRHCGCREKQNVIDRTSILQQLCYGCRLILKDVGDSDLLPSSCMDDIRRQINRANMKKRLEGFLLEDV